MSPHNHRPLNRRRLRATVERLEGRELLTATHLVVAVVPPVNDNIGGAFGFAVAAEDANGQVSTDFSGPVTVSLRNNPAGATLGGVTTVNAVNGYANFSGLGLDKLSTGDTLLMTSPGLTSATASIGVIRPPDDYLFNGSTQVALFDRVNNGLALWHVNGLTGPNGHSFGSGALDVPLTEDFVGDGKSNLVLYRPSTGQWFSENANAKYAAKLLTTFGEANVDVPVPGNYDGTTEPAVYRPTTGQWFIEGRSAPSTFTTYQAGDEPVPGNYDNTGLDELAVYRPGTGQWIINSPGGVRSVTFGGPTDIPVPGAYSAVANNHSVEPAVWRPSTGQYFIHGPSGNRTLQFAVGDIPAPGDYEGLGLTEAAVYRPSTGQWLIAGPNDTVPHVFLTYGDSAGIPIAAPYAYRALSTGSATLSAESVTAPTPVVLTAVTPTPVTVAPLAPATATATGSTATTPAVTTATADHPALFFSRIRPAQEAAILRKARTGGAA